MTAVGQIDAAVLDRQTANETARQLNAIRADHLLLAGNFVSGEIEYARNGLIADGAEILSQRRRSQQAHGQDDEQPTSSIHAHAPTIAKVMATKGKTRRIFLRVL